MSKILLSDHDILLKLAVWDLLDGLPTVLQVARQDVFVLPTAKFKLKKLVGGGYDPAVWHRLHNFLQSVREIAWTIPADEQKLFEDTMGIDAGEAVLFSATVQHQDYLLATGDKVSLKALVRSSGCRLVASIRQAGRINRGEAKPGRVVQFAPVEVKAIRRRLATSQSEFARMIGVSVATLQNWEQSRRRPEGPARALLKVAAANPAAVSAALATQPGESTRHGKHKGDKRTHHRISARGPKRLSLK